MYCIKCGNCIPDGKKTCPKCGAEVVDRKLTSEETHELSVGLHNRLTKAREDFDNGMVFVVLGAIFLIIGIMFFSLSYKVPDDPDTIGKVFKTTCFEFYVSAAGLGVGGIMFIIGIIKVIINKGIKEKEIMGTLEQVQNGTYEQVK